MDDLAGLNELIGYRPGRGDGDGEADALGLDTRLRQARNQRVDADHLSLEVNRQPARVSGIDGRIGLDDVKQKRASRLGLRAGRRGAATGRAPGSWTVRPSALTTPCVTVGPPGRARALPMATTQSPTWSCPESPSCATGRLSPWICSTARSVCGSAPTTFRGNCAYLEVIRGSAGRPR